MGDSKLYLLLLLCTVVLADVQDDTAPCLLDKRYKSFHKYEYLYESESLNSLHEVINGPKVSCKVEIEVPRTCHYVVHTKECTVSEVEKDADGNLIYKPSPGADTFKTQMERNPIKVIVDDANDIKLFPEDDELINILNIKRGIISALAVPGIQEENIKRMPTIYGLCETDYTVNSREDIATDVTLTRDLSGCDQFKPIKDHTSPLALVTDNTNLARLKSSQTCNYKFDNQQKHMISGVCTEKHRLMAFSYDDKRSLISVGKQFLTLSGVSVYNERLFDHNEANMKTLYLDAIVDMSPVQDENAILDVLKELAELAQTSDGHRRANLAHRLVTTIRKANADTLSAALPEALNISPSLTYQALFQCGTPECSGAFLRTLRSIERASFEIDAVVYAMGMLPNSSRALVKEMLEMAKFKPSKLIYYATSNAVRRLYQTEGRVTPEIQDVADYALENIRDCTDEQEHIYLTLRVIGNMAAAMGAASPALTSAVVQCINQPAASPEVQQAAIQVFRATAFPEKDRSVLLNVLLDGSAPVQKRIAAYLILMKDPNPEELSQLIAALKTEGNQQAKSFFISHLTNILSSTAQETTELKQKILNALQNNEIENVMDPFKFSRNFKIGTVEGNMIFEDDHDLPREVMLEMTLSAFGYDLDMVEVGMEGKGLEPTVEALLGPDGFFPDTVLKSIYFATDMMPSQINEVLESMIPAMANDRKKRQAYKNIVGEIGKNVNKLFKDLNAHDVPEVMVYLKLMGAELGYVKTQDLEFMAYSMAKMAENLMKAFPTGFFKSLFSSTDNNLFLHYIFMDNEFYLPTGPGVPLRFALSGTFTPGFKGGLRISPDMSEIAFMPSVGTEFVIEFGAHLPDYVQSGIELHTTIYHESDMNARFSMNRNQIKLTIPTPKTPATIFSITNSLVSVGGNEIKAIPPVEGERIDLKDCIPAFPGFELCGIVQVTTVMPICLNGDNKIALQLQPTGEVTEYTAAIDYAYVENTDKITVAVKAEGVQFGATSNFMFNRKKYSVSADLQVPNYDIEAGIRIGAADASKMGEATHSIQIDVINKNINEVSLTGLANLKALYDASLQVELQIPSLEAESKLSATIKDAEDLTFNLESDLKLLDSSSLQKLTLIYDGDQIRAEIKSDISSDFRSRIYYIKDFANEIITEFLAVEDTNELTNVLIEKTNTYLETSKIPIMENLRVPSFQDTELPEKLFLNMEAGAKYHLSQQYYTIKIPMPHGGKSLKDLKFPPVLTTLPDIVLAVDPVQVRLSDVVVPEVLSLYLPKFKKAELFGKLSSNLYDLDASMSAEKDITTSQSYSAKFDVTGKGSVDVLSFTADGSALLTGLTTDTLKAEMTTAVSHKVIDARVSIVEEITMKRKISLKSSSTLGVKSPLGLNLALEHSGQFEVDIEEIDGDSKLSASFVAGPFDGDLTLTQGLILQPFKPEALVESLCEINSALLKTQNHIKATFANGELSVTSGVAVNNNILTNNVEVSLTTSKIAVKADTALASRLKIQNIAEASVDGRSIQIKFETTSGNSENHINSMIITTIDKSGLLINSDASIKLAEHKGTHKASLNLNKNGLTTSGNTSVNSFLTLQNSFDGIIHSSKASLSVATKGNLGLIVIDNSNTMSASFSAFDLSSKSRFDWAKDVWYIYDAKMHAEPSSAYADITNNFKLNSDMEMKHTCEVKLADLTGTAKCSANGKLMGAHLNHDSELEVIGLNVRISNGAQFNSQPVRLTTSLKGTAGPFYLNMHALANGDGEINLFGKHSAQVYSKFLLKAENLAIAHSHENRVSVTHKLNNDVSLDTNFDNKIETLLSPSVQSAAIKMNSKINSNLFTTALSVYNNQDKIGLEVSGVATSSASSKSQDYSLSTYLKYDKNTEMHVISLPLLETLPAILDKVRITTATLAEALQDYIKREEFAVKMEALLQHTSEFLSTLNLEEKTLQLKDNLILMAQQCPFTKESLEAVAKDARNFAESFLIQVNVFVSKVHEILLEAHAKTVAQMITALNEKYDIRGTFLALIETMEELIDLIDPKKLKDSEVPIFQDTDLVLNVKNNLKRHLKYLKDKVKKFNIDKFAERINELTSLAKSAIAELSAMNIKRILDNLQQLVTDLDIIGKCKVIQQDVQALIEKYQLDKKIDELLKKLIDLFKQFNVQKTVQTLASHFKPILFPLTKFLDDVIRYLKITDVRELIEDLNKMIGAFFKSLKSFEYNQFVDKANQKIKECTEKINNFFVSLDLPKKMEVTKEFLNHALSYVSNFLEKLRKTKVSDVIKTMNDLMGSSLNNVKEFAKDLKRVLSHVDLLEILQQTLQLVSDVYTFAVPFPMSAFNVIAQMTENIIGPQPIIKELEQIIQRIVEALETAELELPSFTVPLTDLVVPSKKFVLAKLEDAISAEFNLPQFTILGTYTVPEISFTCNDIKQILVELLNFVINFRLNKLDDVYFGEFTLNYLPELSDISLPEINFPHISFPALPKLNNKYILDIPLQIPEIKVPKIPTEFMLPAFGKLSSGISLNSPYYTITTSAEISNSTDNQQMHHFTAFVTSVGNSPVLKILNYNFDATARVGIPKLSRVVLAESLKFIHNALSVEHQASVTLYGLSAQATAQSKLKANTKLYKADFTNSVFLAMEGGMSASFDTNYNHQVNLPFISLTNEAAVTQKVVVSQKGTTIKVTVSTTGNENYNILDLTDEITHKSELQCTMGPRTAKISFTGETDSGLLNLKKTLTVDAVPLRNIDFESRIEAKSTFIKSSVLLTTGKFSLQRLKAEFVASHATELVGVVTGALSNGLNIMVRPLEITVDSQNKGNVKISNQETLSAKIDLQNDYNIILNSNKQHITTGAIMRINQNKYNYNFTIANNNAEVGIYAAVNGKADLEFLTVPVSVPEIFIPGINVQIPSINDINLYETSGLNYLLSTKPAIDLNTKIVYQKSKNAPIAEFGLIYIPSIGNFNSEMSFKSSVLNLITSAGMQNENDPVIRIAATSTSVYQNLNANLEATSTLTFKEGLKLATALTLKNAFIEGTHNNTLTLNRDNLDAAVAVFTVAKMNLPVLSFEANHKLLADTKTQPNAVSTLKVTHKYDIPFIDAVGNGAVEHTMKIDSTLSHISAESTAKSMTAGTFWEAGTVTGALMNEASMYINGQGLRSKLKSNGNLKINYEDIKVNIDFDESLDTEAALSRVYIVLNAVSNNVVNIDSDGTNGKHVYKATIDLVPFSSLFVDEEYDLSQTNMLGDNKVFQKTILNLKPSEQKFSYVLKATSPLYTNNFDVEGTLNIPHTSQVVFKSSCKSAAELLEYDLNGYLKHSCSENTATAKVFFKHSDLNMNFSSVLAPRDLSHEVDLDLTGPTFADMILHYEAKRNALSGTVFTPSAGLLGFQLTSKMPFQLTSRLYARYASKPEEDIDILLAQASSNENNIHLEAEYNLALLGEMISGLSERSPAISSAFVSVAKKHKIDELLTELKETIFYILTEAHEITISHMPELSQFSTLFKKAVVQHQKAVENLLNAIIKFLGETKFKLPGMEASTLPEICKEIRSNTGAILEEVVRKLTETLNTMLEEFSPTVLSAEIYLPWGDVITVEQIIGFIKENLYDIISMVKELESLDVVLEELSDIHKDLVEVFVELFEDLTSSFKDLIEETDSLLTIESWNELVEFCLDIMSTILNEFITPDSIGSLDINIPVRF